MKGKVIFPPDKIKNLLYSALKQLGDDQIEETLQKKKHEEYLLDAYNYDQLPRYFFGLELQKLKKAFSIAGTTDNQEELSFESNITISKELFMLSILDVIEANQENIVYILNGCRQLYDNLCQMSDGATIRFKDFVQIYMDSQQDRLESSPYQPQFNKECILQQSTMEDNTYHEKNCKKISVSENYLISLDYSSQKLRVYDKKTMNVLHYIEAARENHSNISVINDFGISNSSSIIAAIYQDQTFGYWTWDRERKEFKKEKIIYCETLQLKLFYIEKSELWISISAHDSLVRWDLQERGYEILDIGINERVVEIKEIEEKHLVAFITNQKSIIFYNETLHERMMEYNASVNIQTFIYIPNFSQIIAYGYDNSIVVLRLDILNMDVQKVKSFGICQMSKMVLGIETFPELQVIVTIDEEGFLKSWDLQTLKFIQKIPLKMQRTRIMYIKKISRDQFVVMGRRLKFYEFKFQNRENEMEINPMKQLFFDKEKELLYIATNYEVTSISLNTGNTINKYDSEGSNFSSELKDFYYDTQFQKLYVLTIENVFQPVVSKEKLIQNSRIKQLTRVLGNEVLFLICNNQTNEIIVVYKRSIQVYQVDQNQSSFLQRTVEVNINKLSDEAIQYLETNKGSETNLQNTQDGEEFIKFLKGNLASFAIKHVSVDSSQNRIIIVLNFDLIIICNYSDFHLLGSFFLTNDQSFEQSPKKLAKNSRNSTQKSLISQVQQNSLVRKLRKIYHNFQLNQGITSIQQLQVGDKSYLVVALETNVEIWQLSEFMGHLKIYYYTRVIMTRLYSKFLSPMTTCKCFHYNQKVFLYCSDQLGNLFEVDLSDKFLDEFICDVDQPPTLDQTLSQNDKLEDIIQNKGRFVIDQRIILQAQSLQVGMEHSNLFLSQQKLISYKKVRADEVPIVQILIYNQLSIQLLEIEGFRIIFTISKLTCKLWTEGLNPLGCYSMLKKRKEEWNIQMLNQNAKYKKLLETRTYIERIICNLNRVISSPVKSVRLPPSLPNDNSIQKRNKKQTDVSSSKENGSMMLMDPEIFNKKIDDYRQLSIQRQQQEKLQKVNQAETMGITQNLENELNTFKHDSKNYQQFNRRLNYVYSSVEVQQGEKVHPLDLSKIKPQRSKLYSPAKSKKRQVSNQKSRMPDYLDYLIDRNIQTDRQIEKFEEEQKVADKNNLRLREIRKNNAKKILTSDLSLGTTKISTLTNQLSPKNIYRQEVNSERVSRVKNTQQGSSYSYLPPLNVKIPIVGIKQQEINQIDEYLNKASDLLGFLQIKHNQLGIEHYIND